MSNLIGKQFGPFEIVAAIGRGGMASVYKAYQASMDRHVAVKIIQHESADTQFERRFRQEARVIAQLEHAHILPVYDIGEADGYVFIAMRLIETGTLADRLTGAPLAPDQVRRVVSQVGEALDYAHSRGVIHRDIKPANILIDGRGDCLLADFGIAKLAEGTVQITQSGAVLGTPAYMSPEQALAQPLDARSDLYSLGVVLYEMAVGQVPFTADTPMAVAVQHIQEAPRPPRTVNRLIAPELDSVILRSLAKQREGRYASARQLVEALDAALTVPAGSHPASAQTVYEAFAPTAALASPGLPADTQTPPASESLTGRMSTRKVPGGTAMVAVGGVTALAAFAGLIALGLIAFFVLRATLPAAPTSLPEATVSTISTDVPMATPAPISTSPELVVPQPSPTPGQYSAPTAVTPRSAAPSGAAVTARRPTDDEARTVESLWTLTDFKELRSPGSNTYVIVVQPGDAYSWTFLWCARDSAQLREILAPLTLDMLADGDLLDTRQILQYDGTSDGWSCRFFMALLEDWIAGRTIELDIQYNLADSIFDGESSYPPGDYRQRVRVEVAR